MIIKKIITTSMLLSIAFILSSCGLMADAVLDKNSENQTNNSNNPDDPDSDTNVNLSSLEISEGILSPAFSQSVTSYSVEVKNSITSLTLSAQAVNNNATISINGTTFNYSGSQNITLQTGTNTVNVIVTDSGGLEKKNYKVSINRLSASTKADLSNLIISAGNLSPSFKADTTTYIVYSFTNPSTTTITPTALKPGATVTVNNVTVSSGSASQPINLNNAPDATNISVIVTSSDGAETKTYNVKIYLRSAPILVSYWPLSNSLTDTQSGFNGFWMGTWRGSGTITEPEYVTEGDRTGVHFRYTANGLYVDQEGQLYDANGNEINENVSGNWVDCENSAIHSELNVSDYLTISLWIFWDQSLMVNYLGNSVSETDVIPEENLDIVMNITSKSVFWNYGWQIRYEQNSTQSIVYLYLHNSGHMEKIPIIDNFSTYRNTWVHITVTIDNINNDVITYVNGIATDFSPQSYTTSFMPIPEDFISAYNDYTGHFAIGAFSHPWGGFTVNGKINDVRFYHGLIDSSQAYNLYLNGIL